MSDFDALAELRAKLAGKSQTEYGSDFDRDSKNYISTDMEKDFMFLGEAGLTSTSANHISNLAKEYVQSKEYALSNVNFIDSSVTIIGSSNYNILEEGIHTPELRDIPNDLQRITDAKSLIAWLREGIKAKEGILNAIKSTTAEQYCALKGIHYPSRPTEEKPITEDEYIASLTIKERNRYFELETKCAVIGKFIHPSGSYSNARKAMQDKIKHPHSISGSGRDALLYTYHPTVTEEEVEDLFFELQNAHRSAQAELNGIIHKMDDAIQKDTLEKNSKYSLEYSAYADEMQKIKISLREFILNESKRVSELKIIIPNDLKDIYNIISVLGK